MRLESIQKMVVNSWYINMELVANMHLLKLSNKKINFNYCDKLMTMTELEKFKTTKAK